MNLMSLDLNKEFLKTTENNKFTINQHSGRSSSLLGI